VIISEKPPGKATEEKNNNKANPKMRSELSEILLRKIKIRSITVIGHRKRFHKKKVFLKNQLKSPQRRSVRRKGTLTRREMKWSP